MGQGKNRRVLYRGILLVGSLFIFVIAGIFKNVMAKSTDLNIPAKVTAAQLNVRKSPSTSGKHLKASKKNVVLTKGKSVIILSQTTNEKNEQWYKISFQLNGETKKGYVMASYVKLLLNQTQKAKISLPNGRGGSIFYTDKTQTATVKNSDNKEIKLSNGKTITILKEKEVEGKKVFYIKTTINKTKYKGYISAEYVTFLAFAGLKTGTVNDGPLNVRQGAGTDNPVIEYNSKKVQLAVGDKVTILSTKKVNNAKWYQVTFDYKDGKKAIKLSGYVSGEYITVNSSSTPNSSKEPDSSNDPDSSKEPDSSEEPDKSEEPAESKTPDKSEEPNPSTEPSAEPTEEPEPTQAPQTEAEFQASLKNFPESYRSSLKKLHESYPYWRFEVYNTGLDWEDVIRNEKKAGLNLIPMGKSSGWLSYEKGAYDYSTDKFIVYDGTMWVTCSEKALRYYMDPRNFLTTDGIFQFENLSYSEGVQNVSGVKAILSGTVLENGQYTYVDESGKEVTTTYPKTFIAAAKKSGVSPYHLASRVKQEVVVSSGLSNSANGTLSGYEGIYNFYNIGASDSTAAGQNIINGLTFASTGNKLSQADRDKYLIPWNNQYKAIVGGAKYIGSTYINRGQNTVYLQKFNVTSYSRYIHQYMSNVEAAKAEGQKMYSAYKGMESQQVTFSIPVYENMPEEPEGVPQDVLNPNNWLKSITVKKESGTELAMTPVFNVNDVEGTVYKLYVNSKVTSVTVDAQAVSTYAKVKNTGTYELSEGTNKITIKVTSQSGVTRKYVLEIIRSD